MTVPNWPPIQPTLTDGTVTLRPIRGADRDAIFRACQDSELQRRTLVPVPYLREHADQLVGPEPVADYRARRGAHFAITTGDDDLIGVIGVKSVDATNQTAEVGFWLGEWARSQGIASRAVTLLSDWLIVDTGLGRLEAYVHTDNDRSWRALERAGYAREGVLRRRFNVRGAWPDMYLYARIR